MDTLKTAIAAELKELLEQWNGLGINPNATERDYTRLREQIVKLCDQLDAVARQEADHV